MKKSLNRYIDHTLLKPDANEHTISALCNEAVKYDFHSVCVNGCHVPFACQQLADSNIKVASVVGFPLGAMSTAAKLAETQDALVNGADEIDAVINIGALKDGYYDRVLEELSSLADLCRRHNALLKVIIETCLLSKEEIVKACELVMESNADFVKTSTGFSTGGATVEDVKLMKKTVSDSVRIKASGGIRSLETALAMIDAGADRLGCSASVGIMDEYTEKPGTD
ncbi:MAG: deoxyribose-phosphate aldolase [Bacillota bacterium]|nr:deoxyribose-phosphate aldolase [Bacillota bacterium]